MKVSVIVLSWNSKEWTLDCLRGLAMHEPRPLYVVDNGSRDGSPEIIAREFPAAHLISSPANLGFGGGNNLGMAAAFKDGCDAVFLLNNDTIIDQPFIEACVGLIEQDPSIGIIGPVVVEGQSPAVVQSRGGRIGLWTLDFSYLGRGEKYISSERVDDVDYVLGAAMLITRAAYERTKGFEEEYFPAYVEEADLCYRASAAGLRVAVTHASRVRHLGEVSSGGYERSFRLFTVNCFRFAVNHLGPAQFLFASQCVIWKTFVRKLIWWWGE